jgi:hypothetical protein
MAPENRQESKSTLTSDKVDFKPKLVRRDQENQRGMKRTETQIQTPTK